MVDQKRDIQRTHNKLQPPPLYEGYKMRAKNLIKATVTWTVPGKQRYLFET